MTRETPETLDELALESARPEETRALGRALGEVSLPLRPQGVLVSLHGDLGAGKTVFVKGVALGLGLPPDAPVVSPTFTIARSYALPRTPPAWLHHVDAYRLMNAEDLELAGFEDMCGVGAMTCVEWAERVEEALPEDRVEVWITMTDDCPGPEAIGAEPILPRILRACARGTRSARLLARWAQATRRAGPR